MIAESADRRARFEALAGRVGEPILRYAMRRTDPSTAEEVVAETMLILWRRLDDVPADAELPWSYGVARNCLHNEQRATRRQAQLITRLASIRQDSTVDPHSESTDFQLDAALDLLPAQDREVLRLWAWEELAPADIALTLDISANAATIRLHRAKRRLANLLEKTGKDAGRAGQEQVKGRRHR